MRYIKLQMRFQAGKLISRTCRNTFTMLRIHLRGAMNDYEIEKKTCDFCARILEELKVFEKESY